jgi:hypothetical protein
MHDVPPPRLPHEARSNPFHSRNVQLHSVREGQERGPPLQLLILHQGPRGSDVPETTAIARSDPVPTATSVLSPRARGAKTRASSRAGGNTAGLVLVRQGTTD